MTYPFIAKPFRGLRPLREYTNKVIAPPYDIVSSKQVKNIVKENPYSFLRVSRAEVDFKKPVNPYSLEVYKQAAKNFNILLSKEILQTDKKCSFYIYRISSSTHAQTGIAFAASIDAYLNGRIKRHELTREKKEKDRIQQIQAVKAQTGPVMLIHKKNQNLSNIFKKIVSAKLPEMTATLDEWKHEIWVVNIKTQVSEINKHLNLVNSMYIADGHHRSAAASKIYEQKARCSGNDAFLAVTFDETELKVLPYNRVIRDLNHLSIKEFLNRLSHKFNVAEIDGYKALEKKFFYSIYLKNKWYQLELKNIPEFKGNYLKALDTQIVEEFILRPILDIKNIRTDDRIDFVGGPQSIDTMVQLVNSGKMELGIALPPTGIGELIRISDSGQLMPPKSTWFEPKLADGLISLKI